MTAEARLALDRCDELAGHSAGPNAGATGIHRVYLTPEHAAVNAVAASWMRSAGMRTWQDAAGNQCGRLEGSRFGLPALLLGSHLDTVPNAGRYDGILGVVAAIAVVARLRAGELPFAVEIVAFGDEEGTRFGTTLLGSRAMSGSWKSEWAELTDSGGMTLREAASVFGIDAERIADAARPPGDLVGYLEAHIEQGPLLEDAGRALGIVSGIAAARRSFVTVTGEARHCATPWHLRRDALTGAAEAILAVERISREQGSPATIGHIEVLPGAVNVIAGAVVFSVDLRDRTGEGRDATWTIMADEIDRVCATRGLTMTVDHRHTADAVACSPRMRGAVQAGIRSTGDAEPLELFSIAGHDAMAMAAVTEVGMVFVRCRGGISHSPEESVLLEDVAAAIEALHAAVLSLAE